jgi:membrane-associated phospholipid phosphatase
MDRTVRYDDEARRRSRVFGPAPGSLADRIGARDGGRHPLRVGFLVWLAGFVVLSAVIIGLGLLLTHFFAPEGLGRIDDAVSQWFVARRTPTLDTVTRIGSDIGSTGVIIGVAVVAGIVLAIGRHWRQLAFLASALILEFTVFLLATLVIDRPRPTVKHLDVAPPTSSYPSGHTAASIALYVGLAIIIWSLVRSPAIRTLAWILAIALPVFVGLSRLYRGMHHMTDVLASVVLGAGALAIALLMVRASVASRERRTDETVPERLDAPRAEVTS